MKKLALRIPQDEFSFRANSALVLAVMATTVRFYARVLGIDGISHILQIGIRAAAIVIGLGLLLSTASANHLISRTPFRNYIPFFAIVLLSSTWAPEPLIAFLEGGTLVATLSIAAMLTLFYGWVWVAHRVITTISAILLVSGILEFAVATPSANAGRWEGLAGSATGLGQVAAVSATLALAVLVSTERPRVQTLLLLGSIGLATVMIALSQSRVPLIVVFVAGATALVAKSPAHVRGSMITFLASFGLAGLVAFREPITALALRDDIAVDELNNVSGRSEIWALAVDVVAEKPFLGHGFASGDDLFLNDLLSGNITWFPRHSHQLFLELLTSLGIVGLAFFLLGFIPTIRARNSNARFVTRFLVAVIVGLGLTEPIFHEATIYAVILGMAVSAGRTPFPQERSAEQSAPGLPTRVAEHA